MSDAPALYRAARLIRLSGVAGCACALAAVALALGGHETDAESLVELAVPLGGAALLAGALLFRYARRLRRQQDRQ